MSQTPVKILSIQPVSLYRNGGASRLLRRLYSGYESRIQSIGVSDNTGELLQGNMPETIIKARPLQRTWMRWKARNLVIWLREKVICKYTMHRIRKAASKADCQVIHTISHGPYTMAAYHPSILKGKQLWVSFHDHFIPAGTSFNNTQLLWANANRRLVISQQMGDEYNRLFGTQHYELITDGVLANELSAPRAMDNVKLVTIYFSGLLHNEYYPLFEILANALDVLANKGIVCELLLRGTQKLGFLKKRKFTTHYLTGFVSDEMIKQEMDAASILYLPIKFNDPEFYLYSLSTKMVGYLGAPGCILYHGPADSAAGTMLRDANAAVSCTSLNTGDLVGKITELIADRGAVSANAKLLARNRFDMITIKKQFWQE
ncbi:glycosyltransferase [Mucilaginibacter glaciei]|uniref:Glycosyltransferase n=1 Tax=Mucilaginibacter glaciei TaxID=2772109 RepID=A0A926NQ27_9SPHI|nr:glycosyltransferase [Mucilaginibacter glaciei]MBD1393303.1 glycosyltransferase [Mucilaginibacter glaciei]